MGNRSQRTQKFNGVFKPNWQRHYREARIVGAAPSEKARRRAFYRNRPELAEARKAVR